MNKELLRKCRDWVAAGGDDQYEWVQDVYYSAVDGNCGTACCVAGFAVIQSGGKPIPKDGEYPYVRMPSGHPAYWHTAGRKVLGLTFHQADDLFDGNNLEEDVLPLLDDLIAQAEAEEVK